MLYQISYDENEAMFHIITEGNINLEAETYLLSDLISHPKWTANAFVLVDHSKSLSSHLSNHDVVQIANISAEYLMPYPPSKVAIVVADTTSMGKAILWDIIVSDKTPIKSQIFINTNQAKQWLAKAIN